MHECISLQMPSLSGVLPDSLMFVLAVSMRYKQYVELGGAKESGWTQAMKGIQTGSAKDPAALMLLELGELNLKNINHAIDLDTCGLVQGLDWPKNTKFLRKPEKILLESILWSLRSAESYQHLIDTIWQMFPECSKQAETFRLKLFCSVADIEIGHLA